MERQERVEAIRARMEAACGRAGRKPGDVRLIAVSKTFGPDDVREAAECGLGLFGESKVQEARHKIPMCPGHIEWLMIGHLQRNKVREAVRLFQGIHSVDTLPLLEAVNSEAAEAGKTLPVLLEINVSGERSKFGMAPESVPAVLERAGALMNVDVLGLMTLPPFDPEPEKARPFFRQLRALRDAWRASSGFPLNELSMGMSQDFEVAIEEGATWIRVGTGLFGTRKAAWRPSGPAED